MTTQPGQQLVAIARAAREMHAAPSEPERFAVALRHAIEQVPGCTHAGLVTRRQRKVAIVATSGEIAQRAGERADGPEAGAMSSGTPVIVVDLHEETRWKPWTAHARETLGLVAVICIPLQATKRSLGALALYFDTPICDVHAVFAAAEAFATHLALALESAGTIEHQTIALETRTEIGQAQGILMARSGLTADAAFAYLQRLSQTSNRKLHVLAREVVHNRGPISSTPLAAIDSAPPHGFAAASEDSEM